MCSLHAASLRRDRRDQMSTVRMAQPMGDEGMFFFFQSLGSLIENFMMISLNLLGENGEFIGFTGDSMVICW